MIKFVYFDVGGVVIKDFSGSDKWEELKQEWGITPEKSQEFIEFWDKYEPDICLGKDTDSLKPMIERQFGVTFPENYSLLRDGFVNRFETNKFIWPVIAAISKTSGIGLLTNMYPKMLDEIRKAGLLPKIKWAAVIDSSVDKIQKPDRQIFALGELRSGFKGNQILFVENGARHIRAANDFGWQTFLYDSKDPKKSSRELLNRYNDY